MLRGFLVAMTFTLTLAACRPRHVVDAGVSAPEVLLVSPGQAMATHGQGVGLIVPPPVTSPPDDPTQPVPPPGVMRVLPNTP